MARLKMAVQFLCVRRRQLISFSHKYIFNIKIPQRAIKEPLSENSCSNSTAAALVNTKHFHWSIISYARYERRKQASGGKFPFYCPNLQARNAPCSRTSRAGGL
jgi:hypothetical protein